MKKLKVMEKWFDRVWRKEDASTIYKMFPGTRKATGLGKRDIIGPDEFAVFQKALLQHLSKVTITVDKSMEKGNWIFALCTMKARKKGTKEKITMHGSCYAQIKNGRINVAYNNWDFISLFEQLGLLPPDTFATCLSGQTIGREGDGK